MSDQYTVVLPGNIEPHFNTRRERDAFVEWKDALQARIEELKLALDKADPLDPSFLRYLELEQALAAEREKVIQLTADRDEWQRLRDAERERAEKAERTMSTAVANLNEMRAQLQAERERAAAQAPEADHVGGLMSIPAYKASEAGQ